MEAINQSALFESDFGDGFDVDKKYDGCLLSNEKLVLATERKYGLHLQTYFYNRLRSYNDVEDLLQELYCRLMKYQGSVKIKSLRGFVFTIAVNLVRDKSRRSVTRMAEKTLFIDDVEEIAIESTDPLRIAESMEDLMLVDSLIGQLTPSCEKAFRLHRMNGLSQKEIALLMGVTVSMVEKHIMRATKYLRQEMGQDI